jgi:Subtilase family
MKKIYFIAIGVTTLFSLGLFGLAQTNISNQNEASQQGQPCVGKEFSDGTESPIVGVDCKEGEILAILNDPDHETSVQKSEGSSLVPFFKSVFSDGINLTGIQAMSLSSPANAVTSNFRACSHTLLIIRFQPPSKVQQAIDQLRKAVKNGGLGELSFIQESTIYGIQPNGIGTPGGGTTSESNTTKGLYWATERVGRTKINQSEIYKTKTVRVAVLDTGISDNLDSHGVTLIRGLAKNFLNYNASNLINDDFLPYGHGTAISSLIGSEDGSLGIAPNAHIVPIKVCASKKCNEASTIIGVCYAASKGVEASIINLSLATLTDPAILSYAIEDVSKNGSVVISAAGNTRDDEFIKQHPKMKKNPEAYPAAIYSGTPVSVGAEFTDAQYATFATANEQIDLVAPGSWLAVQSIDGNYITSNSLDSKGKHINNEGTSYSTAYVSGAVALLLGKALYMKKNMTAKDIIRLLKYTSDQNLYSSLKIMGYLSKNVGLIDIEKAWASIK